ncbi:non-ribosomal peptide synthetase [Saccharibacillus alkalitolerans]|uniref:Amino acid adenylation domain-containing protein n=1 Tax=Saccharibacillus alkalitolerans TaxID=2705290 RepID=A0ABX0FB09_9BACL|nr:non-ribosomal peptide synthetase [Saccharibacillus alkalitolerans]NGZ77570.1 amino acid adenylation domain-containing protein [Saccharibacillus alkalitolerans]
MNAELKHHPNTQAYWLERLRGVEEKTVLSGETVPALEGIGSIEREFRAVDAGLLRAGAAHAAWSVLLQRYLRTEELAFAAWLPGSGSMIPLLFRADREETFRVRAEAVKKSLLEAGDLALAPEEFAAMYASLQAERPYNTGIGFDLPVSADEALANSGCDLFLAFSGTDRVYVRAVFRRAAFGESFVKEALANLQGIVVRMFAAPDSRIGEEDIIGEQEREILLNLWNRADGKFDADLPVHRMIKETAARVPEREAVVYEGGTLSYAELDGRSDVLAAELRAEGLGSGRIAGIMARPSAEMILSVLAVLKTGAAYLPIDPEYPQERIRFMLEDSGADLLLLTPGLAAPLGYAGGTLQVDNDRNWEAEAEEGEFGAPEDPAYVIYTSGSTGTPKGVVIEHRSLINLAQWHVDHFRVTPEDRTVKYAGFGFDASVWEIFPYLLQGAAIHMIPEDLRLDPAGLNRHFNEKGITIAFLPTQLCEQFMEYENYSLRVLLTGGDKLKTFRARPYELHNCYGPTENTIVTSSHLVTEMEDNIPIGKPVRGSQIMILDAFGRLQPVGAAGELCVAGVGLARGYLNRPELTAEKFTAHPYRAGERMYRTGDLARWKRDGTIEFLGRLDHQVKVRGFRIEIGEIEQRILERDGVRDCIVAALKDPNGEAYLCAYVESDTERSHAEWSEDLSRTLPDYMVPAHFVTLEKLPVNANGKIDRRALPEPAAGGGSDFEAPSNEVERRLHALWSGILGHDRFGVLDRFFDIGGHSLQAAVLRAQIDRQLGASLSIRELFEYATVRTQAAEIAKRTGEPGTRAAEQAAIPAALPAAYYPAYPAQSRLFLIEQMEGAGTAYNAPALLRVEGRLDADRLERSLRGLIRRHEALRTSFELLGDRVVQRVHEDAELRLAVSRAGERNIRAMMDAFVRPFDLSRAPLMRAGLVSCSDDLHFVMLDFHHIAVDGVSMHVFFEEWSRLYRGESPGTAPLQFKDFSVWYEREAAASVRASRLAYWKERLAGELPMLQLPLDKPRPEKQSFRGDTLHKEIGEELRTELKKLADRTGTTLFMVMLAAYGALLGRYAGQEDLIVGVPVANRSREELHGVIGMFVNTLPLRMYPDKKKTFAEYLQDVKSELLGAFDHQEYELGELVNELNVPRSAGRSPLFDTMFVMQNTGALAPELDGADAAAERYAPKIAKYDLMADVTEHGSGIRLDFQYCTDLFGESTIGKMADHYIRLLQSAAENEQVALHELPMLGRTEQASLICGLNDTVSDYERSLTIQEAFERRVLERPHHTAVAFEETSLTYAELNERANRLAHTLVEKGVGADKLVGLMLDRSPEMIVGLLGILKAGGAYVPIDPEYPEDRILYMLENSGSDLLLTQRHLAGRSAFGGSVLCLDEADAYSPRTENLPLRSNASDLLYVIYTSGTTGRPKGVMIEHRNMINLLHYEYTRTNIDYAGRVLQFTTISFDVCSQEIWSTLLAGGTLCMIRSETRREVGRLLELIERRQISVLFMPVSFLKFILSEKEYEERFPTCIRHIVTAGEQLVVPEKFREHLRRNGIFLHNHYGPSETHVATAHTIDPAGFIPELPPIGKPITNTRIYILNDALQLQPQGAAGELYIAGDCVGRGYYNQPELTNERYSADPFETGGRMYKTGDLARWNAAGELEFLGRLDHQVKIRGFRIELGEIETALLEHESVKETIVVAKEDASGGKYLCAYTASPVPAARQELRRHLADRLPDYMIPSYFVHLDVMPLTPNGKIDRRALPEPQPGEMESGTEYAAPQSETECRIAEVWRNVLGTERIGLHDNFFELGGHSLKAAVMVARLQEQFELSINNVFEHQTLAELAAVVKPASNRIAEKLAELKEASRAPGEDTLGGEREAYRRRAEADAASVEVSKLRDYRGVLLTGATGYVGIHLLHDMLALTDWEVYAVVRGDDDAQASRRIRAKLDFYFGEGALSEAAGRLHVFSGDLSEDRLGMSDESYRRLEREIDAIVHAAATVKHYGSYDDFKRHNVEATERLIDLAEAGQRKDFHHISTLGVATGIIPQRTEAFFGEYDLDLGQEYENYYAKTKFEAEKKVVEARERGLRTSIYRLGNVVFHSETGRFQENIGENAFYTMMQSFVRLGIVPELAPDTDFSYVDGISRAILLLMRPEGLQNEIFHLLNPNLESMHRILTEERVGRPVQTLEFAKFVDKLTDSFLANESRAEVDKIMLHYGWLESAQIQTRFEIASYRTAAYLERLGFVWKAMDDTLVSRMLAYAEQQNFFDLQSNEDEGFK